MFYHAISPVFGCECWLVVWGRNPT